MSDPVHGLLASQIGYDDQMYFSRVFRKRVGASPSEFRKNSESPPAYCEVPSGIGVIPAFLIDQN